MKDNDMELIKEIATIPSVEEIDAMSLTLLKLKAIELLSNFAIEKEKKPGLLRYSVVETPDFGAYFSTDSGTGMTSLVFRQSLNNDQHYHFSNAPEIIKGVKHIFGKQPSDSKTPADQAVVK